MNELQRIFEFNGQELRSVLQDGEPWFVAKDVCDILGISKYRDAVSRLDDDERGSLLMDTLGGKQQMASVNESGLYELIFASRKPEAKFFKRWVKQEVLPSIRKHGAYMTPETIEKVLLDPDAVIQLATQLKDERQKRLEAQQKIKLQQPIVDYYHRILNSTDSVTTTQIAQDYGMSAYRLNKILHDEGVQYKVNEQWILYGKYKDKGLIRSRTMDITHSDGHQSIKMHTQWTQKGRVFIHRLLENRGIFPQVDLLREAK